MANGTTRREMMQKSLALAGVGVFGVPEWALPVLAQDEVPLAFTDIPEDFGQPAPGSSIRVFDIRNIDGPYTPRDEFYTIQHFDQPVPLLIYLGREAKLAVGTSFVFILMVAVSSVLAHYRLGNVEIKTGLIMALGGIIGAQIGPHLLQHLSDQSYKRIFSALLIITAVWLFASTFNSSKG